ncbi:MAG: cytochrome B6 [Chloroflexota bacterium]|nr:MAG: cytochrome B6 [Chloroflexota bacterium]
MAHEIAQAAPHVVGGPVGITRRWFLRLAVLGSLGAIFSQSLGCFISFYYPLRVGTFGGKVLAGKPEDLKVGDAKYVREGKFYLTRTPDGFLALYQKCPHLGCVVPWKPDDPTEDSLAAKGRFNCPCHGSIYDRFGVIKAGPAPRPMDMMAISIENGNLLVDTGKITQRAAYDPSQAFKG